MKKITLLVVFVFISLISARAQTIHCDSFAVFGITLDTVGSNTLNVTINNFGSDQVNYPSVLVVNAAGDTIANKTEMYFFFAQIGHDTLTHTIPTTLDSLPCNATYTIYYTDNIYHDSCIFTYFLACPMGVNEVAANTPLILFPNPASEKITILLSQEQGYISIYNLLGESIQQLSISNRQSTLDVNNYSPGLYFIELRTGKGITRKKFIKE